MAARSMAPRHTRTRDTWLTAIRRTAPMATTTTRPIPARPTAITGRAGSQAVSLSASDPGTVGAIVAGAGVMVAGPGVAVATMADVPASELAIAAATPVELVVMRVGLMPVAVTPAAEPADIPAVQPTSPVAERADLAAAAEPTSPVVAVTAAADGAKSD